MRFAIRYRRRRTRRHRAGDTTPGWDVSCHVTRNEATGSFTYRKYARTQSSERHWSCGRCVALVLMGLSPDNVRMVRLVFSRSSFSFQKRQHYSMEKVEKSFPRNFTDSARRVMTPGLGPTVVMKLSQTWLKLVCVTPSDWKAGSAPD
ncbi:hypothetical protein EVAR_53284_1 [Eumeta japonica]|uniref:Uncharacterized protein n=1 Tax=Eumeta variegata TaxID=151549 RepID=A0A4C1YZS7_EUMVA|nr:hypothetical protein EVAR_53284_1 [Eumeta japonica]